MGFLSKWGLCVENTMGLWESVWKGAHSFSYYMACSVDIVAECHKQINIWGSRDSCVTSTSCLSSTAEDRNVSGGLPPTLDVLQPAAAAVGLSHGLLCPTVGYVFKSIQRTFCVFMHVMYWAVLWWSRYFLFFITAAGCYSFKLGLKIEVHLIYLNAKLLAQ